MYLIGENGTGKTNTVLNLILSDIHAGRGIGLIEPYGDLTTAVLAAIPEHRLKDVMYWDIEDYEAPFGLNIFQTPQPGTIKTRAATANFVAHIFERIWAAGTDTPRLMQNIRAVTRTLIENPGMSLGEVSLLYTNPGVRNRLLSRVHNPQALEFWEEYNKKNQRDRFQYSESFLNKVTAFLDEVMIRNIFAQSKTSLNFRTIMDQSKILLIKLSPQFSEASELVGSVVIGQILMAAFSRADTPEDKRVQFNLYCDEWHRFATPDFATLISESRKFRTSTTLSHQVLDQLDRQNRAAALASGTLIVFRVSGEDSTVLAKNFSSTPIPSEVVIGDEPIRAPAADPISQLTRRGHTHPDVAKFISDYLHPPGNAGSKRELVSPPL